MLNGFCGLLQWTGCKHYQFDPLTIGLILHNILRQRHLGECFVVNVKVESPEEFKAYDPRLFELLGRVFNTHRIPMDVFHARRIRPVTCPAG
jgi:hypothetical protein